MAMLNGADGSGTPNSSQAGAIKQSDGFANARAESPSAPGISFYRNRYYDQATGRFTQDRAGASQATRHSAITTA